MIGDDYFDLRAEVGRDLQALGDLVRDLGADLETTAIVDNLIAGIKEPFIFVVVVEVNVGKSTFLNALFGQDFSRTGVIPTTDKILFFKHGPTHQVQPLTSTLEEVQVPCDFLKDFHIVDTPGTNSIENEHQQITERFVPIADLVIFVFSAMNPWGASAWQFLEKVHRHWMRHVVFVLQQCDLRSPEEVQVISDYMAQLSRQRFGRDFPLFAVSAKKAYMARSSGIDRERLMAESGFTALENHISDSVTRNTSRINKLASTLRIARQILEQFQTRTAVATEAVRRKAAMIEELQSERELQASRTLAKLMPALDVTERDYQEASARLAALVDEKLRSRRAFQSESKDDEADRPADRLDHRLFQDILNRTTDRWRQMATILEQDYAQYQRFLIAQGRGQLFLSSESIDGPDDPDSDTKRRFIARIESTLRRFVIGLELDESLEPGLKKARRRARWVPWSVVPALALAGAAWWLDGPVSGAVAFGAGSLLVAFSYAMVRATLSSTRSQLIYRMEEASGNLRKMLEEQVVEHTDAAFSRFLSILDPAREEVDLRNSRVREQAEQLGTLAESLESLDQRLRAAASAS